MTETTDTKALSDSAEFMANLLDNLAGFEPQDIDMDAVELRFEDENGFDTGCDISIVDTAKHSADIIRALLDQLEAERQRADKLESYAKERDSENESIALTVGRLRTELAALRGEQEPVATMHRVVNKLNGEIHPWICSMGVIDASESSTFRVEVQALFTRQPKPVVVLSDCDIAAVSHMAHWYTEEQCEAWVAGVEHAKKQMLAAGIVVKDGE